MAQASEGLLRSHAKRQIELDGQLQVALHIVRVQLQRAHMRIDVSNVNPGGQRAADLGPPLNESLFGSSVDVNLQHFAPQIALRINETGDLFARRDGTPAVFAPFRRVAQVNPEVLVRMSLGVGRYLREPRARHHDGRAAHEPLLQSLGGGQIGRMAHACVVTVDDQQFVSWLVAEALGERGLLGASQAGRSEKHRRGHGYEFGCQDLCRLHA